MTFRKNEAFRTWRASHILSCGHDGYRATANRGVGGSSPPLAIAYTPKFSTTRQG
jgi:hypothetical protein